MVNIIEKGWGREIIFADNNMYCGKLLVFDKTGSKGSMHYHLNKHETWYVNQGSFKLYLINPENASLSYIHLYTGDRWVNERGFPHQLEALEDNSIIFEVSTSDDSHDSYRVLPGDSQNEISG